MILGKLDRYMQKNETRQLSYTIYKNKLIKLLENKGSKILDISFSNIFPDISPQSRETQEKIKMGLHQTKQFCTAKKNPTINKMKTTY